MKDERILKSSPVSFLAKTITDDTVYRPLFYRLTIPSDRVSLELLLEKHPHIIVQDELEGQLQELLKSRNPGKRPSAEELNILVKDYLNKTLPEEYGVWVYYPWSSRLIHLLDEAEFIEVRTNRNQYKITKAERDLLGTKKIGVIGLSVGKTISMAMAMERGFGEIRLADFDRLELTNLNRIQTGVQNLGISKAIAVAREISEMDPYLQTVCYCDGLTRENMDDFFLKGGKLDILVEECDGLDIKIICRQKAKALGIPVVMDMNDRGTLDVERFDLEPDRPLLHGMIDHLDISKIGNLSNEDKIPFILPMLGEETISSKLKASMLEIGHSLSTWPQLGSSVVLGGALAADVCRRIILNQFHESGRYFVDLEELICDKPGEAKAPLPSPMAYNTSQMRGQLGPSDLQVLEKQLRPDVATIKELVSAAVLAPSDGNLQPWQWLFDGTNLYLFVDPSRSGFFLDKNHSVSLIALGAATENLVLKAHSLNLEVRVESITECQRNLAAVFRFFQKETNPSPGSLETHAYDALEPFIPLRRTGRKGGQAIPVPAKALDAIRDAAQSLGNVHCSWITEASQIKALGQILGKLERIRMLHKECHNDWVNTIRWTPASAMQTKDGIDLSLLDLEHSERANIKMAKNPEVIDHLRQWKGGGVFERLANKYLGGASVAGLLTLPGGSPHSSFIGGRCAERAWLTAQQQGLSFLPLTSAIYLFSKRVQHPENGLSKELMNELNVLHEKFITLFRMIPDSEEIILFRLVAGESENFRSLKRDVNEVLYVNK
jgi:hypothetical protein